MRVHLLQHQIELTVPRETIHRPVPLACTCIKEGFRSRRVHPRPVVLNSALAKLALRDSDRVSGHAGSLAPSQSVSIAYERIPKEPEIPSSPKRNRIRAVRTQPTLLIRETDRGGRGDWRSWTHRN